MRSKRGVLLTLLACGVVGVTLVLAWPREAEPSYQGKRLSEWLSTYERGMQPSASDPEVQQRKRAERAVRTIGTNAVPVLLNWMDYEVPRWRDKLLTAYYRYLAPRGPLNYGVYAAIVGAGEIRAEPAVGGFEILGSEARQAVAELTRRMALGESRAAVALGLIGEDGLAPLLAVLADRQSTNRIAAAMGIGRAETLGTNANRAVVALVQCLNDRDARVARSATLALGRLALEPDVAVPALTETVSGTNGRVRISAIIALGRFKDRARSAVPVLVKALGDPAEDVRAAATNAFHEIAPEVLDQKR